MIGVQCVLCKQRNISGTEDNTVLCSELIKHMYLAGMLWGGPAVVVGDWVLVFASVCFILVIATARWVAF